MTDETPEFQFRPHHFMCAVGYIGLGYSPEFTENFSKITDRLRGIGGDSVPIGVTPVTDSICEPCPNRRGELCTTQEKITRLDQAHAAVLGWKSGEIVTWGKAKSRIRERVTDVEFSKMCEGCGWKPSGVCEKALKAMGALALGLLLSVTGAMTSAASQAAPTKPQTNVFADEAVTQLRNGKVKTTGRATAVLIRKASKELDAGKYAQARKTAGPVSGDALFADIGLFIKGQAYFLEARKSGKKNAKAAVAFYEKALEELGRVREVRPETSLSKDTSLLMAEVEFGWSEAMAVSGKMAEARNILFRGLQRLSTTASLTMAPTTAVDTLIVVCREKSVLTSKKAKQPEIPAIAKVISDPFCEAWIQRLVSALPKASGEQKRITTAFGTTPNGEMPARGYERKTISYSAAAPDEKDFREAIDLVIVGENSDGKEKLEAFLKEYPRSTLSVAARYWLGQIERRKGNDEDARKHLVAVIAASPLSYYGILSSIETGTKTESFMDADVPKVVTDEVYLGPKERLHFERAKALISAGEKNFSALELKQISPKANYSSEFLIYLASLHHEVENYLSVFQVVDELLQRSDPTIVSSYGLRLIFPTPHLDLIQKIAKEQGVDPLLVLSLMKQESAFEAKIASGAGAQGLMQLMPATAVETDPDIQLAKVIDPDDNVRVGTKYLAQMIKKFQGNTAMALAAYNAGPHRVSKWTKGMRTDWGYREFIESIPFKETRGYVASIMRNYFWYTYRLQGKRLENLDTFWGAAGATPGSTLDTQTSE